MCGDSVVGGSCILIRIILFDWFFILIPECEGENFSFYSCWGMWEEAYLNHTLFSSLGEKKNRIDDVRLKLPGWELER